MLEYLRISNLALIEDMALEFSGGINVLTGETGVGKSFIIKALGFLLGDKLQADMVRAGAERARVEALFTLKNRELLLRRELVADSGRSRFFINDVLSSQENIKEYRQALLSHTSQHAQQQLLLPAFQTKLMESVFPSPDLLAARDKLLNKLQDLGSELNKLENKIKNLSERRELLEIQKEEISRVAPKPGEEEKLEEIRQKIRGEETFRQNLSRLNSFLYGQNGPSLLDQLADFEKLLEQLNKTTACLDEDIENVDSFRQQLSQLPSKLRAPLSDNENINMDDVEERLFTLAQLKRKLKRTLPEILSLQKEVEDNLSFLDACSLDKNHLEKQIKEIEKDLKNLLDQIKPMRRESAQVFAHKLEEQLKDLGFSEHVKVMPDFQQVEIWPGIFEERTKILWAPNPGQAPQALDKIASGGELSRFLLAWISLRKDSDDTTFIFDEVDAGIGGMTLNKVAEKIQHLAKNRQIILITHWPQLAAKAKKHFQIKKIVKKDKTYTLCESIAGKARQMELARMAGGGSEGQSMVQNLLFE